MRQGRRESPLFQMEYIIIQTGRDDFMCLSGERIETDSSVEHAVTLRLSRHSAARIGQATITVSESEILKKCEFPKATELPATN